LHVGGNGGIHLRGTDLLSKVTTEQEALDVCAAFIQLYREQAWYLERTAPWIERVGLDYVKAQLFDDPEAVAQLAKRFHYSQQFMQDDPWARRAAGEDSELHQHLAEFRPFPTMQIKEAAE
jgi:nitrite reductase (NADH) large subunit